MSKRIRGNVQFPVAQSPAHFGQAAIVHHRHVSKPALAVFERLQPYKGHHGPLGPPQHPLSLLKEIADADKHRVLAMSFGHVALDRIPFLWDSEKASGIAMEPVVSLG